jgi:molybdate transport system substrate-binding protein
MKKFLALLLSCAMVLSMAACGSSTSSAEASASSAASEVTAAEVSVEETEEPAEEPEVSAEEPAEEAEEVAEEAVEEPAETLDAAEINVFIAASLNNAFEEIVALYNETQPDVTVLLNADSSGTLLEQIENGFACDIFFSAAVKQMTSLEEDQLVIDGTRVDLLKNQLALITYKGSGTAVTGLENLADASSMALADGSVPAGKYTRKALQGLGVLDADADPAEITTQEVSDALGGLTINETSNVSKTLEAVAEGSNEVGTVYYSDAYSRIDDIDIIEMVPADLTGDIIYPMCRVQNVEADDAITAAADDFYAFLQTDEVMEIFEKYMFLNNAD